jgi:hypothetical protein
MPLGAYNPGAFLVDFTWNIHYRTIRAAQLLVRGIDASNFSDADKAATRGFARTMQANQYIRLIETRDTIGLPITTGDGQVAPVRCKPAVLDYIAALLDSAAVDLTAAGAAFPFVLSPGFTLEGDFSTPATFRQFNRALAAKVDVYRGFATYAENQQVNAAALDSAIVDLTASFESQNPADFRVGVYHTYSTASGDLPNGNTDLSVVRANPRVLNEAQAGDARLSKIRQDPSYARAVPPDNPIASSDIQFTHVTQPTTPLPIIIDEELLLLHAEALWGKGDYTGALGLMNLVRRSSGALPDRQASEFNNFTSAADQLNLLRAILYEKRYSLLFESGSRLVDYRMFGLFTELGEELAPGNFGPKVIPFPQAEIDARGGTTPACTP